MRIVGRHRLLARVRVAALLLTAVVMTLAWSAPAGAQGNDGPSDEQIVLTGELVVPQGDTVGDAVIFNGPATVEGTVNENLVVFNGDVEIIGTVRRDVVAFNGDVVIRDGAEVRGNLVTQGTAQVEPGATVLGEQRSIATSGGDLGQIGVASRFAWWLAYSISTLVLGVVLLLVARRLDPAAALASRERTGASIGIGLAVFLLLPIVGLLLLATILALPLGVFLLLAIALIYTVGYVVGAHAIGRRLVREPKSRFLAFLAGWGIVRLLGLIPFVGGLVWTLVTIFGLGVIVVAARRAPSETVVDTPTVPPYPLPAT